jgi:hypothetical protein
MRDAAAFELDPTAREIYDLLRRQPGDHVSAQDIAVQLNEDAAFFGCVTARATRVLHATKIPRSQGHH